MATAMPAQSQGVRSAGRVLNIPRAYQPGTLALNEDEQLRALLEALQSFTLPGAIQPGGIDINQALGQIIAQANDLSQQGPEAEGPGMPSEGSPQISPEAFGLAGGVLGPLGTLTQSSDISVLGDILGITGNLANASPEQAGISLGGMAANLAGANPAVVGGIQTVLGSMLDPVPMTPGDIAGKAVNLGLSLTPIGIVNTMMNLMTGKTVGSIVKGAMTPVENVSVIDSIVQQANQQAQAQGKDPMDVLMNLTNAFGTAPPPPVTAAPSVLGEIPAVQMLEVAKSLIDMPEPAAPAGAPAGISTPADVAMSQLAESIANMPTPEAPAAPVSAPTPAPAAPAADISIGLDLSSIDSGIAGLGLDVGFGDISFGDSAPSGDSSSGDSSDGAPSSPSDGDGTAY